MRPTDCPKFNTCNANICPLDPLWPRAVHLEHEPVCFYLRSTSKAGAEEHFADDPAFQKARLELPVISARHPDIARQVRRASRYGIQGASRIGKRPGMAC
jgi:hypothetical protein